MVFHSPPWPRYLEAEGRASIRPCLWIDKDRRKRAQLQFNKMKMHSGENENVKGCFPGQAVLAQTEPWGPAGSEWMALESQVLRLIVLLLPGNLE